MSGPNSIGGGNNPTRIDFTPVSPTETDKTTETQSPASTSLPDSSKTGSSGAILRGRELLPADKSATLPSTGNNDANVGEAAALTLAVQQGGPPVITHIDDHTDPESNSISLQVTPSVNDKELSPLSIQVEKKPDGNDPDQTRNDLIYKGLNEKIKKKPKRELEYLEELGIFNDLADKLHANIMNYITPRYPIS